MPENAPEESVWWINVVPHNRREKIARWWVEDVRQQHTYISERERVLDFSTTIATDMIDTLASDGLKAALRQQLEERLRNATFLTVPRATSDGTKNFEAISIPTRPIGQRFTARGIEPDPSIE